MVAGYISEEDTVHTAPAAGLRFSQTAQVSSTHIPLTKETQQQHSEIGLKKEGDSLAATEHEIQETEGRKDAEGQSEPQSGDNMPTENEEEENAIRDDNDEDTASDMSTAEVENLVKKTLMTSKKSKKKTKQEKRKTQCKKRTKKKDEPKRTKKAKKTAMMKTEDKAKTTPTKR